MLQKRHFVAKLALSGKPYALLLPTKCIQSKGLFTLFQTFGVTIGILVPPPPFWTIEKKRKNVVDCSWFFGNFPNNKPNEMNTIWLYTAPISSLPQAPVSYREVATTQVSQDYSVWEDEATPRSPRAEELIESCGLVCDKCAQVVDDEHGFAGSCRGELCKESDVHLCRNCAFCVDDTLSQLYCRMCLDNEYEGEEYTAYTYAEIVSR